MDGDINKKVLCITDRDLKINCKEDLNKIKSFVPTHIAKLLNNKKKKLENKKIILNKNTSETKKYKLKIDVIVSFHLCTYVSDLLSIII